MKIQEIHREAIRLSKEATAEFDEGNFEQYNALLLKAFELEKSAAEYLENKFEVEPTRSVLYRSAATLAFKCEKYTESIDLITQALRGNPFEEIKMELISLLKESVDLRTQPKKTNNYLQSLRDRSISFKLEEKTDKYSGAFNLSHVSEFLKNINNTYKNYGEVKFSHVVARDSVKDYDYTLNKFRNQTNLLGSDTGFSSFGINVSVDKSVMDHFDLFSEEYKEMYSNLFAEFKEDVLYPEYEDPAFQERISKKFTDEERKKIFSPILNSISKSKDYKISITDNEFKTKVKEFKPLNTSAKKTLDPVISNVAENEEENTNLTKKIVQTTGSKTKTILAENIKYFEMEYSIENLEYEKKKVYFKEPHFINVIFENNYFSIHDDIYKIEVSDKDFDRVLAQYYKSFILNLSDLFLNTKDLSDEQKELFEVYQNTTVRDW